jgi:hypothetical protein
MEEVDYAKAEMEGSGRGHVGKRGVAGTEKAKLPDSKVAATQIELPS